LIADSAENARKRARIDDILNDEHDFHTTTKRSSRAKKGEAKIQELREIVGRRGKGPVDYRKLAEEIQVPINLLDLFQISPDLVKNFKKISTRTNNKKKGKGRSADAANCTELPHVGQHQNTFPSIDLDHKAFRIPAIVRIRENSKHKRINLPPGVSQADQGSDINVVSPALAKALSAKILKLSSHGWNTGLQMMTADGSSSQLTEFCKLHNCTQGVWRRIWCFIRPGTHDGGDLHLLLGLPWLNDVDAKIFIRSSYIEIGDTAAGDNLTKIQGPIFVPSIKHRLVLLPKDPRPVRHGRIPVRLQEESEHSESSSDQGSKDFSDDTSNVKLSPRLVEPEQVPKLPKANLVSQHLALTAINDPLEALRVADGLLSRGIDPDLGGPRPYRWERELHPRAWGLMLQSWNIAHHRIGNKEQAPHTKSPKEQENGPQQPHVAFPTQRRPESLLISADPQEVIDKWFDTTQCKLGSLIPNQKEVDQVKRLLYTYKELNATELSHIPPTDLYEHKVRLRKGTKPHSVKFQRRWPPEKEFWLMKIVKEAMACGIYERTLTANGELSDWNADAVLVNKPGQKEPRITFNYRNVWEDMPGCYLELMSKVHDYLSNPSHRFYHQFDLKHGYWCVPGNCNPPECPQGSHTSGFSFTELMYIALGEIPHNDAGFEAESSLTHGNSPGELATAAFYMDDVFCGTNTYESAYQSLEKMLCRLRWARLRLSFHKLKLFVSNIIALGVSHTVGGIVQVVTERSLKLREWPVPKDATQVRAFIGAIGITRRWIKNFGEIQRPLSRLTGKVEWRWGPSEQLSFEILRDKCSTVVDMFGWDYLEPVRLFTDASLYAGGCVITQIREEKEVPILYNSVTFSKSEKNYGTYKRELFAMVSFARKHDYMLKGSKTSTIFTDHHPFIYFLESSALEEWAGSEPRWIWKDDHGGYEELLRSKEGQEMAEAKDWQKVLFGKHDKELAGPGKVDSKFLEQLRVSYYCSHKSSSGKENSSVILESRTPTTAHHETHKPRTPNHTVQSSWYDTVTQYLRYKSIPPGLDRVKTAAFLRNSAKYREEEGVLYYLWKERWRRCITQTEVARALHKAHDEAGHFASEITLRFLRDLYWPSMLKDTHDYIEGCLTCAKHGTALRSKTLSKFLWITSPVSSGHTPALPIIRKTIQFLGEIFEKEGIPVGIYADEGPHFQKATREFCRKAGVVWIPAPVAAKRSVGMVEKANDLLQRVLVKGGDSSDWSLRLNRSTFLLNRREIAYLGFSPFELHRGYLPESTLSSSFPSRQRHILAARLENIGPDFFEGFTPPPDDHVNAAIARVLSLQEQF
ncbi:hypothetical protein K3495_g12960, partial [Podosphaera aphanis]